MKPRVYLLIVVFAPAWMAPSAASAECAEPAGTEPILDLRAVFERSAEREPALAAERMRVEAAGQEVRAAARELAPELGVRAEGDLGQRARPGDERELGRSARGDATAVLSWDLIRSERGPARLEARRDRDAQIEAEGLRSHDHRLAVAQVYVEAALAVEIESLVGDYRERVGELAEVVRRRSAEGVEDRYEIELVEDALARLDRVVADASSQRARALVELADWVGYCAQPEPLDLDEASRVQDARGEHAAARHARAQAAAAEASASRIAREEAWRAGPLGAAGLYASPAFEGSLQPEYYVGFFAEWRPDVGGIREARADAERLRAIAHREEAQSLELESERAQRRWEQARRRLSERRSARERERKRASRVLEIAELRWREGVGPWREVLDAVERLEEVELELVQLQRETALALIDLAEQAGRAEQLPSWLTGATRPDGEQPRIEGGDHEH